MKVLSSILALILFTGCSANYHLKKAVQKDPSILTGGAEIEVVHDTLEVITEAIRVDTLLQFSTDTVEVMKDRVRIRTVVDTVAKTVFVDVECPPDTVFVPYEKQVLIKPEVEMRSQLQIWKEEGLFWKVPLVILALIIAFALFVRRRD